MGRGLLPSRVYTAPASPPTAAAVHAMQRMFLHHAACLSAPMHWGIYALTPLVCLFLHTYSTFSRKNATPRTAPGCLFALPQVGQTSMPFAAGRLLRRAVITPLMVLYTACPPGRPPAGLPGSPATTTCVHLGGRLCAHTYARCRCWR